MIDLNNDNLSERFYYMTKFFKYLYETRDFQFRKSIISFRIDE